MKKQPHMPPFFKGGRLPGDKFRLGWEKVEFLAERNLDLTINPRILHIQIYTGI